MRYSGRISEMLDMHEIRLTYEADLPARSGLGTSSSFAVGMLNAFYALKGKYADKKRLADEAIYLERNLCQEAGGWQDQIAASFGGFNRMCEELVKGFRDENRWEEVFDNLYGEMPKYSYLKLKDE